MDIATEIRVMLARENKNISWLANELNTYDVLYVDKMIITEDAVKYVEEVLK